MAWLLHFTGEGYGEMAGVSEYVKIVDDGDALDEEREGAPGFKLASETDLTIDDPPCTIPSNRPLMPRY